MSDGHQSLVKYPAKITVSVAPERSKHSFLGSEEISHGVMDGIVRRK
jgi:hypothetical protein